MNPLEAYLIALREIRSTGEAVNETSYYGALENLFNEAGKALKPRVRCNMQLKNRGAGNPDGGFFTEDQLRTKGGEKKPLPQLPARGVVEVKSTSDDAWLTAASEQVSRYWQRYRQVLVTNYRDFVFIGQDFAGNPVKLETYRLASSEAAFWDAALHAKTTDERHGEMFMEFAKRALLHAAPLAAPEDVAWFLASYARDALARIGLHDLPALAGLRKALEEALGLTFEGEKGEHFFRSTLVQTLFYGVFSAWVLWSKQRPPASKDRFEWTQTARLLRVAVLRKLFHEVTDPRQMEALNLTEILDWTSAVLNRVDRAAFFNQFEEGYAVQYFYEPFLQAFDPELRKQLGVWYTPPEIVRYMVARVDRVLREELDLRDGLADKNVYVLDPCCGTGSYLVEVLKKIHETLKKREADALIAADLKEAARKRVFGFEILPAPFVVSHLQLSLLLQNLGSSLTEKDGERIGVFLTNALTGWGPPASDKKPLLFPELQEERDAAEQVKRETPVLVVLGNPPYNGYAGVAVEEERALTTAYRTTTKAPAPQGQGLNDLYVRFYRMAEHRIAEMSGRGIVCFISNYSWLDGLSFTGMRESYLEKFDRIWIDCLNGDKYKTGKLTPEGNADPSVFSTKWNKEGIQIGTAIGLLCRKANHVEPDGVEFRSLWGTHKRESLLQTLEDPKAFPYEPVVPPLGLGLPFVPVKSIDAYENWPLLTQLLPTSFPGVQSKQDQLVVDIDRASLVRRMEAYFDTAISHDQMAIAYPHSMDGSEACDPRPTREFLQTRGFRPAFLVPFEYRPFDKRWIYWEPETHLLGRKSPDFFPQVFAGNAFVEARQRESVTEFARGMVVSVLADNFGNGFSNFFPKLLVKHTSESLFGSGEKSTTVSPNLSEAALSYLRELEIESSPGSDDPALFFHIIGVLHSPTYRTENLSSLRKNWPRVPLPDSTKSLRSSAQLGLQVAALLDTEVPIPGVTAADIRHELKALAVTSRLGGGALKETDLELTAKWGHLGREGITMPGKGQVIERDYSAAERRSILDGSQALGITEEQALSQLGDKTNDVYLNNTAYWCNVPTRVWEYTIGGYQVLKKWLSYREKPLLGRPLTVQEARYVQEISRRIAAILLLQPALDSNYESIKENAFSWSPER